MSDIMLFLAIIGLIGWCIISYQLLQKIFILRQISTNHITVKDIIYIAAMVFCVMFTNVTMIMNNLR